MLKFIQSREASNSTAIPKGSNMTTLDELYAERGELLDQKYFRSQALIAAKGYYCSKTDFADINRRVADITEQIEIVETAEWLAEAEADAADYADEKATQQNALGTLA